MIRRCLVLGVITPLLSLASLSVTLTSIGPVQAVMMEQGFSGACTISVSLTSGGSPIPDFDSTLYSGAGVDTARGDTAISPDGGTRWVTVGHMELDRPLSAVTSYFYTVSGCGSASGQFVTANIPMGNNRTEQSPFNSTAWGNLGLPQFNWGACATTGHCSPADAKYTDPLTGATLVPLITAIDTWRTGCGGVGCSSGFRSFTDWTGGSGWSNPGNVLNGSTSTATTTNNNPIDLYIHLDNGTGVGADPIPYDYHRLLEDIGAVVWAGSTTGQTLHLCIFLNPTTGCASNTLNISVPIQTLGHITSGSSDADGTFPSGFPSTPFASWTSSPHAPLIRMENRETFGTLTYSTSSLTLSSVNRFQHFSTALAAGAKVFITGSSCTNSLCTLTSTPNTDSATIVESIGSGTAAYHTYGWGVRAWFTGAGTGSLGLKVKLAGSNAPMGAQADDLRCSTVPVTPSDGHTGYLCSITGIVTGAGWIVFISNDGITRILTSWSNLGFFPNGFSFDDIQPNVFYSGLVNSGGSGGWSVEKWTYSGDYITNLYNPNYTCDSAGACPAFSAGVTGTDIMPHGSGSDLNQQIVAKQGVTLPVYDPTLYGAWTQANGQIAFRGTSGHFAFFQNTYSGQGQPGAGGPGWIASVDLSQSPAQVVRLIHTLDGTGLTNARFGSLHNVQAIDSSPNSVAISVDPLATNSTSVLYGGPWQVVPTAKLAADGVTWNPNTSLAWPVTGTPYFTGCPSGGGIPTAGGTPYTQCVTVQMPAGGLCNVKATATEVAAHPCAWNAAYGGYPSIQVGDNLEDCGGCVTSSPSGCDGVETNCETFRVLQITVVGGNWNVVLGRNSTYDYCSSANYNFQGTGIPSPLGKQSDAQLTHPNGWILTAMMGTFNTCGSGLFLQDQVTGATTEFGHSFQGHYAMGAVGGNKNFVTGAGTIYASPYSLLGQVPPPIVFSSSQWGGNGSNIGGQLQSYTDDNQSGAGSLGYLWATDTNFFVNDCGAETLGCGPARTLTYTGSGDVWKIASIGTATASTTTYKSQPMIGMAGRYQLQDVSGPTGDVTITPYTMCYALVSARCGVGTSSAGGIYINVPHLYSQVIASTAYYSSGISWASLPGIIFGDNAPAGASRQFKISSSDVNGNYSRFISNGWAAVGRDYAFTHTHTHPAGLWAIKVGSSLVDGFEPVSFLISYPPWVERSDSANQFKSFRVTLPAGQAYAVVKFGYSRYQGPNGTPSLGYCTSGTDVCLAGTNLTPFAFASETFTATSCASGCTIDIPVIAPNTVYYSVGRSSSSGSGFIFGGVTVVESP